MAAVEEYRAKALEFQALARAETDPHLIPEWKTLALCYARLAEQAERSTGPDVSYEAPKATGDGAAGAGT